MKMTNLMQDYENLTILRAIDIIKSRLKLAPKDAMSMRHTSTIQNLAVLEHGNLEHEEFKCMWFDVNYRLISYQTISIGTLSQCAVYPRQVIKSALAANASFAILTHNHPSGSLKPSTYDIDMTHSLQKSLRMVDIVLHDHLIIVGAEVYSMLDNNQIPQDLT